VFSKFNPDFKLVVFKLTGIDNETKLKEAHHLLNEVEELTRLTSNKENMKNHYLISPWVVAQQKFGEKAKHYHTSLERLMNKVLKNKTVADNEVLTNLLRYISLKYFVPIGVDDQEKVQGNLTFELATGKEKISPLKTIKKEALYYHDQKNVLGTKLDYWKSKRTLLTRSSTSALIHFEILPPLDKKQMDPILKETKELIKVFCGGKIKTLVLDKKKSYGNI
tara:strand:+ start:229 stop:894 length:666 start_codon:yes stop_codon:yes gene_type:complete